MTILLLLVLASCVNFYCSLQILKRISASSADERMSFWDLRWQVVKFMQRYHRLIRDDERGVRAVWCGYWISLLVSIGSLVTLLSLPFF
jgi:hypothetical protein